MGIVHERFCVHGHDTHVTGRYKNRRCAECYRESSRAYIAAHPEYDRLRKVAWAKANPQRTKDRSRRQAWKRAGIRITDTGYNVLFDAQRGLCAVCGNAETMKKNGVLIRLAVDHKHNSNKVRGLLCRKCNQGLGMMGDNVDGLMRAVRYLERNKKMEVTKVVETSDGFWQGDGSSPTKTSLVARGGAEGTTGVDVDMAVPILDKRGNVDIRELIPEMATLSCRKHPRFRGLRRPRNRCERCVAIYEFSQRTGVKEKRVRRRVQNWEANA